MIYLHDLVKKANMTYAKHIFLNMGAAINAFNFYFFGGRRGGKSIKFSDIIFHLGDFHIRENFRAEFFFIALYLKFNMSYKLVP